MSERELLKDKTLLITGGTGSFGRTLAKQVLEGSQLKKVIIFSRDEWKQWEMKRSHPIYQDSRIRYFLGDVRDKSRLLRAFDGVDYVVHAAALKHVPVAEYNPSEFVKTNVHGAMNVIDAAIDSAVQRVIALSTDKAVNPVNLYGATKLCSDKLFVGGGAYVGERGYPLFSIVRYGNVLASRGSIIPLWQNMLADGAQEIPVTDERMTRFWITLENAVRFVIRAFGFMEGGEIFIPKIPSMKIIDLADAVAPKVPKKICGIREGEKLHELLISAEDARQAREFDSHYTIYPQILGANTVSPERFVLKNQGNPLPDGFIYASNTNQHYLDVDQLRQLLGLVCCNESSGEKFE